MSTPRPSQGPHQITSLAYKALPGQQAAAGTAISESNSPPHLSCHNTAINCEYAAKALPINHSEIMLATSLTLQSMHNSSNCPSHSTTHCWGDSSISGISFRSSDICISYPVAMGAIAWAHYCTLEQSRQLCYDRPSWDDARLHHGDITKFLELEYQRSTTGGSRCRVRDLDFGSVCDQRA
ncbi:hypothetical protein T4D_3344 [Trichinella pseudospiralis]|uniref:Uncharacterized protein n=1 Tax=Trichinella pseudospiralis TaxID=6337 RepID=A0A0V1F7W4_TRIPS|nr:hypothetical protein T4D_3344 [Trichinella pseudospiralis]